MNLSKHAERRVYQESVRLLESSFPRLDSLPRRVLGALLARTVGNAHLFVREDLHERAGNRPDAFLINANGIFALIITEERVREQTARTVFRYAEERCAGITDQRGRVVPVSAIHPVIVGPGTGAGRTARAAGPHWSLPETDLARLFRREDAHLTRRQVHVVARQAGDLLSGYARLAVDPPEARPETAGLLDAASLAENEVEAAQARPFDSWLTFLHPHQHAIVARDYNGPARISGPAGTGKTVVVLHRLRRLARNSTGPLLFSTFVRNLPTVHAASFRRLAPEVAERVEFLHLHAWLRRFLQSRGRAVRVSTRGINTAFARAWTVHRASLRELESSIDYWRAEVDRVIKGRGLTTFEEYLHAPRRGRKLRLDARHKELVWELYETYQAKLSERDLHDYNDMIQLGDVELRREPLAQGYAAIAVDEVQDITLTGLRLLRRLAGDGPNRLLLVGDGQQQVYPGGWRLSDAGIPVQGRGEVLRVNYRNRRGVLDFARGLDATNEVDDLDGGPGVVLGQVEAINSGGECRSWSGPAAELPAALLEQIATMPAPLGQTALIVFHHRDLVRCRKLLHEAGIATLPLEDYTGAPDDRLKIGTVHRAKGLEFRAVLVVQFDGGDRPSSAAREESTELRNRQRLVAATRARDFVWWGSVCEPTAGTAG
ncbi:UvrD-helicase domain-containing protein [Amycolatopsis sp. ATCC 39116]|uniref:UvrD-helicase domain-containing protein n=1 Tax=Amycolatopsis sp. (strain ATCC 39116 / 75iv2) TaxID=385957 RepID=UPI000262909F|nr:UvrD-helicase domain-containing protein [Amycolatopsis sp. ATCC 39116]